MKTVSTAITIISVIAGIVMSVINFRIAKEKEAESRKIEAAKPFLELRQKLYLEALNNASVLASKDVHTEEEANNALKRFSELYWGELSLIEESSIEANMVSAAVSEHITRAPKHTQSATYKLAHVMRESLIQSWGVDSLKIGTVHE